MASPAPVRGLHHFAYRCRDAEETRAFYEDVLGLPLAHVIRAETVPSTGEYCPYVHIFFQMTDGSYIAFFDLGDDVVADPSPNTPSWVNHIALQVDSVADLERMRDRLTAAGVEVLGITDHHFVKSIYFFDPNGLRCEFTTKTVPESYMETAAQDAHRQVRDWIAEKEALRAAAPVPAQ